MEIKSRSVILASILNVLASPVGHVYVGRSLRGVVILSTALLVTLLFGWAGAANALWSFYSFQFIYIAVYLIVIVDGGILAYRSGAYNLKRYNRWYIYVLLILFVGLINSQVFSHRGKIVGLDNHRILSVNMAPLLQTGDFIATDTRKNYSENKPARGDVITFIYPKDPSVIYIKRVIALPGEKIFIKNGIVHINGEAIDEPYVSSASNIKYYSQDMPEIKIPNDHLFVLGDNRDNSNDSRFWGMLPIDDVVGKSTLVWYSQDL